MGEDAVSLARLVAPGGSVVAIDGSQTMITAACEHHGDVAGLSFNVADPEGLSRGRRVLHKKSPALGTTGPRRRRWFCLGGATTRPAKSINRAIVGPTRSPDRACKWPEASWG